MSNFEKDAFYAATLFSATEEIRAFARKKLGEQNQRAGADFEKAQDLVVFDQRNSAELDDLVAPHIDVLAQRLAEISERTGRSAPPTAEPEPRRTPRALRTSGQQRIERVTSSREVPPPDPEPDPPAPAVDPPPSVIDQAQIDTDELADEDLPAPAFMTGKRTPSE